VNGYDDFVGSSSERESMPPVDDEVISTFLSPEAVGSIYDQLLSSPDPNARMLRRTISDNLPPNYLHDAGINVPIEIEAAAAPSRKKALDAAVRHVTKGGTTVPHKTFSQHFENSKNWGLALLQEYFVELRKKLCGKGKTPAPLGHAVNAGLVALGASICKLLGVSSVTGLGLAVLVVTNAAWIGKVALCKMTSPDQLTKYFA
jgi:hypothetical protein